MLILVSPEVQCLMRSCTMASSTGCYHTLLLLFMRVGLTFPFAKNHSSAVKDSMPGDAEVIVTLGCSPPQPGQITYML